MTIAVRPEPIRRRIAVRFAAASVAAFGGVGVTCDRARRHGRRAATRERCVARRGIPDDSRTGGALEWLSQISLAIFVLVVAAVFVTGLIQQRGGLGSLAGATMGVSVLGAELLKEIVHRPELVTGPAWLLRNSFPSGTVAVASAVAVGAFLVSPDRLRSFILPVGVVFAAVISDAVQTTGWHRLSDSIGATLLVIGVVLGGLAVMARVGLVQPSERGYVDRRVRGALLVAALVALLFGTAVTLLLVVFPLLSTPVDARRALLQRRSRFLAEA